MNQDKIWDAYQNDPKLAHIAWAGDARMDFITRRVPSSVHRVLNVGVGNGRLEEKLSFNGLDVYCLDPSEKTIARMRERLNLGERAKMGYAQDMPFTSGFFDCVIMSEVLEHLSSDILNKALAEVSRVLRSGGLFIGSVPAEEVLADSVVVCPDCGNHFHRWGHQQSFSKEDLATLLGTHFKIQVLDRKCFFEFDRLNWKGKIAAIGKILQAKAGKKGSGQSFYFECVKG